jgi:hypothetical protein
MRSIISFMGFALWIDNQQAWAAGTHEYRPMGAAVIAENGCFRARDFSRDRRAPGRRHPSFIGLFGSLEEVNVFLRKRPAARRPPSDAIRQLLDD